MHTQHDDDSCLLFFLLEILLHSYNHHLPVLTLILNLYAATPGTATPFHRLLSHNFYKGDISNLKDELLPIS